jgi:hypothetical protein
MTRNAECVTRPVGLGGLSGGQQGFGRHAAGVQALSAHGIALEQHDFLPKLSRRCRSNQACRTAPDNGQIIFHFATSIS